MYKRRLGNNLFFIILACIYCFLYILVSYRYTFNLEFEGDTQVYFYYFNRIALDPYPWGIEFVTSSIMFLVNTIGGDFRFFLFICLMMWVPVVFYLVISVKKNVILIFACPFFLFPLFMANVVYLIRQFHAALFFLIFVYFYYKKENIFLISVLFFLLSVGSHISAVMWFVVFNKNISFYFVKPKVVLAITLISLTVFVMQIDAVSMLVNELVWLSNVLGVAEIDRKLNFYTSGASIDVGSVKYSFILMSLIIVVLSFFLLIKRKVKVYASFYILVLIQSLLLLVLSDNVVAASRFGFFTFYFSVPLFFLLISFYFRKVRVTLS